MEASWQEFTICPIFWMWKPRLREHKALAQSHTDGKWWSQDSNLDLTYSTSLCSSCRGRPQGKDGDRGKKKVQATGGQMKREHSASLEEDHKLHNPQGKREERRKILAWSGCPKSMEKGDSTTDRARP